MSQQGYDITATRALIPGLKTFLATARSSNFPIYHTREGHRPDLSTLSSRERFRSKPTTSTGSSTGTGIGIGDEGPLGRLLVRGEKGHDTIPELYPLPTEPVIDKPGRGAFSHTDFELLLRIKGIKNLIITGVTTDVCVHGTMREANDRGFDCVLVEDGTAAAEQDLHEAAVKMVGMEGGIFGATALMKDVINAMKSHARSSKGIVDTSSNDLAAR